jgi:hypothetical protein
VESAASVRSYARGSGEHRRTVCDLLAGVDGRFGVNNDLLDAVDRDDASGAVGRTAVVDQATVKGIEGGGSGEGSQPTIEKDRDD